MSKFDAIICVMIFSTLSWLCFWSFKRIYKHPPKTIPNTEDKILMHNMFIIIIGIICVGMAVFIVCLSLTAAPPKDRTDLIIIIIMSTFFSIGGVIILLEFTIARVIISYKGIIAKTPWPGYPKRISWEEIVSVSFTGNDFVIMDRNNVKIKIDRTFNGLYYLSSCFRKYLIPQVYEQAERKMQEIEKYVIK